MAATPPTKRTVVAILGVVALAILIGLAFPVSSAHPEPARYARSSSEAQQVALALKIFATDHQNALPETLEALVPEYLSDKQLLRRTWLTLPGAKLDQLPKQAIIAFRLIPEESSRVVVVRADVRVEIVGK